MEDKQLKIGVRVQQIIEDDESEINDKIMTGVIELLEPATKSRPNDYWNLSKEDYEKTQAHVVVRWDDGSLSSLLSEDEVDLEDTEMERQFRNACLSAKILIKEQLEIADKALSEAEAISKQYGVPFRAHVSPINQSYYPSTIDSFYPELDEEFISDLTGAYTSGYTHGWAHSAVC